VLDLYCGTGTIALFLARHCQKVIGIEIVAPAIADAKQNAELNGISNAEFICGDAVDMLPNLAADGVQPDVVVIDPPRAGCERKVLEVIAALQPERIVYVSCNPASLARDLAIFAEQGYLAQEIQPVDLFPQTFHVECCVWLKRKHSP
jgi:23S rRNA (uracil1939-C5)-methyltransferase